jgi:hypothetical protein
METNLAIDMLPQADFSSCGPTCLSAVYRFFGDHIPPQQVDAEVTRLDDGGTLAVYLACHALRRSYKATIYTYNLQVFDPTWFSTDKPDLASKLRLQLQYKQAKPGFEVATNAYLDFLGLGGELRFEVLTASLIRRYLNRSIPIVTGLSATYLYNSSRELSESKTQIYDDIRGESMGHFVVLVGYDRKERTVLIADPLKPNPLTSTQHYEVSIYRLVCAIMLGVLTYDGDLLIIERKAKKPQ